MIVRGMATDPPVSEQQRKAMWAAANGHSTLGIPQNVGKEFVGKDGAPLAAGLVMVAPDGDVLLLRRSSTEENYAGHWALPGGKADDGETAEDAARREFAEECGLDIDMEATLKLLQRQETPNGMVFSTFAQPTADKLVPKLNGEHSGYCWAGLDALPQPLHPGVAKVLGEHLGVGADMTPEDWSSLRTNFAKWTREEETESEHAEYGNNPTGVQYAGKVTRPGLPFIRKQAGMDAAMAMDKNLYDARGRRILVDQQIAMDRGTVRSFDRDGRLRVSKTNISKANICPYYGHEIPGADILGLDPNRRYALLRHPDEIRKAAKTSNNVPLLITHVPVDADDHQPDKIVGALGTDGDFDGTFLTNSLIVWAREGIDAVESEDQQELSCGYHYRPDMTPGTFMGTPYDGVMRDIEFNHVALVPQGRAGADVLVADSQIQPRKEITMPKVLTRFAAASAGALAVYLKPKMATDSQIDLSAVLDGVTSKNFKERKAKIAQDIKAGVKLAKDANLDDMIGMLDKLEDCRMEEGADADPNSGLPMSAEEMAKKAKDAAGEEDKKKKDEEEKAAADKAAKDKAARDSFRSGLDADKQKGFDALFGEGEKKDDKDDKEKGGKDAEPEKKEKDAVDKKAMDSAIQSAVENERKNNRATQQAYEDVEPYVGKLQLGMDSASDVYRTALKGLGMDAKQVDALHPDALKPVLQAQKKPGESRGFANDAIPAGDAGGFASRWGDSTKRIGVA